MPMPKSAEQAIVTLHAAIADVANGDVAAIKALYEHSDDATSFYGWGGYEKGWAAVSARWDWAGEQFKGGKVTYRPITRVIGTDMALTTDIETFEMRGMAGLDGPTGWSNRVTHVFRKGADGAWRLLHRQANRLEEQYAPSTRLKTR